MRVLAIFSLLMLCMTFVFAEAQPNVQVVPCFLNGLDVAKILACEKKYQAACPLSKQNIDAAMIVNDDCINKKMAQDKACEQARAIRELTYYPANQIKQYGKVSVFYVTTFADGVDMFYMVDISGNLISLTDTVDLANDKTYQKLIKKFPKAELTTMLHWAKKDDSLFPATKSISNDQAIIYKQTLRDGGCVACATVGVAEVAYLFSKAGVYQGVSLVGLKAVTYNQ